jgi:hypothetical protein
MMISAKAKVQLSSLEDSIADLESTYQILQEGKE